MKLKEPWISFTKREIAYIQCMIINQNFWLPKYISWVIEQWSNSWICSAHAWVVLAFSVTSKIFLIMKIRISHTVYYIWNFMNYFVFCNVQRFCNCDDIKKYVLKCHDNESLFHLWNIRFISLRNSGISLTNPLNVLESNPKAKIIGTNWYSYVCIKILKHNYLRSTFWLDT